jgi:hypothetical protein
VRPTDGDWHASATLRTHGAKPELNGIDIGSSNGVNVGLAYFQAGEHTPAEVRANARLMAASKELRDAAQRALELIISRGLDGDEADQLRGALEKAGVK